MDAGVEKRNQQRVEAAVVQVNTSSHSGGQSATTVTFDLLESFLGARIASHLGLAPPMWGCGYALP
jgi:hypothetical protein